MNCTEVQSRLSDYLDKTLDVETLREIDDHLSACAPCSVAVDELADCIRQVAALPLIDPPLGFTQRVMARIREIESTPPIWQRMLLPLQLKLPLHATAVILIAILAVYLWEREEPRKLSLAISEQALDTERLPTTLPEAQPSIIPQAKAQRPREVGASKDSLTAARENSVSDQVARARRTEQPLMEQSTSRQQENEADKKKEDIAVLAPPPPPVKGLSVSDEAVRGGRAPVLEFRAGSAPALLAPQRESASKTALPGFAGAPAALQPFDVDLVVRRHPRERDAGASGRLGAQRKSGEEASVVRERAGDRLDQSASRPMMPDISQTTAPQTVWLTIPAGQYERLKKELGGLGTIESESPAPSRDPAALVKRDGSLRIKITIEPFVDAERAPPATPAGR